MSGKMARNQTKAFTLIELMVVVVILAIMGVLILPHLGIGKSYTIIAVNGWVEVKDGDKTTTTLNPSAITNIEAVDETHVRISVNRLTRRTSESPLTEGKLWMSGTWECPAHRRWK